MYDFSLEMAVTCYFDLLGHFLKRLAVIPTQNCSTFKQYGEHWAQNKKLIKKLLVLEYRNCEGRQIKKLLVRGADPRFC